MSSGGPEGVGEGPPLLPGLASCGLPRCSHHLLWSREGDPSPSSPWRKPGECQADTLSGPEGLPGPPTQSVIKYMGKQAALSKFTAREGRPGK